MVLKSNWLDEIPESSNRWGSIYHPSVNRGVQSRPLDRRDVVPVTLGSNVPQGSVRVATSDPLSKVVIQERATDAVLGTPAWYPTIQTKRRLPVVQAPVLKPPMVRSSPTPDGGVGLPTNNQRINNVGFDLGNLVGKAIDVYGDINAPRVQYAQSGPQTVYPGAGYGTNMLASPTFINDEVGIPGVEIIRESELDKGMVYKKVCGQYKWVKQTRRRRRKLLTESDYNGLLKLQTLKVNQNMTVAIAKAIGR